MQIPTEIPNDLMLPPSQTNEELDEILEDEE